MILNSVVVKYHIRKKIVHEEVKFPCRQCNFQATTKGSLAEHKRAVHEGVKYPCGQCNHRAKSKGDLAQHKTAVHEEAFNTIQGEWIMVTILG